MKNEENVIKIGNQAMNKLVVLAARSNITVEQKIEKLINIAWRGRVKGNKRGLSQKLSFMKVGELLKFEPGTGDPKRDYILVRNAVFYRRKKYKEEYSYVRGKGKEEDMFLILKLDPKTVQYL